jgi:phage gpG-like protein
MAISVRVDDRDVVLGLGELRASVSDRSAMLNIIGVLMQASVARTFREEGSPAGSWPALALSTLKNKKYKSGHKLLILSGRLFSSITYVVTGDTLEIGTNVVYARVQQSGSADRMGASSGPQAKIAGRGVKVGAHSFDHVYRASSGDRFGKGPKGGRRKLVSGVRARHVEVKEHSRHQNIPPRPFLVIRPEDPARFVSGIEAYLGGATIRLGTVGVA